MNCCGNNREANSKSSKGANVSSSDNGPTCPCPQDWSVSWCGVQIMRRKGCRSRSDWFSSHKTSRDTNIRSIHISLDHRGDRRAGFCECRETILKTSVHPHTHRGWTPSVAAPSSSSQQFKLKTSWCFIAFVSCAETATKHLWWLKTCPLFVFQLLLCYKFNEQYSNVSKYDDIISSWVSQHKLHNKVKSRKNKKE